MGVSIQGFEFHMDGGLDWQVEGDTLVVDSVGFNDKLGSIMTASAYRGSARCGARSAQATTR